MKRSFLGTLLSALCVGVGSAFGFGASSGAGPVVSPVLPRRKEEDLAEALEAERVPLGPVVMPIRRVEHGRNARATFPRRRVKAVATGSRGAWRNPWKGMAVLCGQGGGVRHSWLGNCPRSREERRAAAARDAE